MPGASRITLEDVATYPRPGMAMPGSLKFSPGARWLTWLESPHDSLSRELFALELGASGMGGSADRAETAPLRRVVEPPGGGVSEDNLSPEEKPVS